MNFTDAFPEQIKTTDILFKAPRSGDVEIVAIDVPILIAPVASSPNDIGLDQRQPYRERFGGVMVTPRTDFRQRNNIIQPTTALLANQALSSAFGVDIPTGKEGQLRITVSAVVDGSSLAIEGVDFRGNAVTEAVEWETGDPASKATDRTFESITSVTPSGFANETADVVFWEEDSGYVVRRVLNALGSQQLEMETTRGI